MIKTALFLILIIPGGAWAGKIEVRGHTVLDKGTPILLSQILRTTGISDGLQRRIEQVELGNSPKIGEKRVFSAKALAEILRDVVHKTGEKNVRLSIPKNVVIERKKGGLNKQSVSDSLMKQWAGVCKECRVDLLRLTLPVLPETFQKISWKLAEISELPRKSFNYRLVVTDLETKASRSFWVSGEVTVKRRVLVTRRALNFGETVTPKDVQYEFRDVTFATDSTPEKSEIVGVAVKKAVRAGEILWHNILVREKKFRRGDIVKAMMKEGTWEISLHAIAQEDGVVGKMVKLKSMSSKKLLVGMVNSLGEVEIK